MCVNAYWVPLVRSELAGSPVKVCTVVGFPLGATSTEAKTAEARTAVGAGAREIDMVINIGALKSGDRDAVRADIESVVRVSHQGSAIVKVIIETALLTDPEKTLASVLAKEAGADYVKTSTGFSTAGRHCARYRVDARRCRPADGREGFGRHPHARRFADHDSRGRDAHRRQRQR